MEIFNKMKAVSRSFFITLNCILFYQFICQDTFAQTYSWSWAKNASGGMESANTVVDQQGNIYVSVNFNSPTITFGSYTLTHPGGNAFCACLAKFDASGNVLWATNAGGSSFTYDIAVDHSGNIYMTGSIDSSTVTFGNFTLYKLGIADAFIVKYDPAGNVIWAKNAGAAGAGAVGFSLAADALDNIYLSGYFNSSSISFGPFVINGVLNSWNIFLVKYDAAGNELWAKCVSNPAFVHKITSTGSGNVYMTGYFFPPYITFDSITLNSTGVHDAFLVKFDSSGNVLWAKGGGGNSGDIGWSVATDNQENVYFSGEFESNQFSLDSFTFSNTGCGSDIFLFKIDSAGNIIWGNKIGSAFDDHSGNGGISLDPGNNIFMSGSFSGFGCGAGPIVFGSYVLDEPGAWDPMFVVKFDQNGNTLFATSLRSGGNDSGSPNSIAADDYGNAYVSADWGGNPFIIGVDTLFDSTGGEDVFVAKLSNVEVSAINAIRSLGNINVYSNPSEDGQFQVLFSDNFKNAIIAVRNSIGSVVFESQLNSNNLQDLDLTKLHSGIYFLSVENSAMKEIRKLVIR